MGREESEALMKHINDAGDDWFKILGLDLETCTIDDVKSSFKKIVVKLHPDKCKLPGASDAFTIADKAYKNLNDPAVLKKFKDAAEKKAADKKQRDMYRDATGLEKWLRQAKGTSGTREETTMEEELSPEARAVAAKAKAEREYYLKVERSISEKAERLNKKERKREYDLHQEAELQDTMGQWSSFQNSAKRRATMPVLQQNVGQVRKSDVKEVDAATTMDYKLKRKNWQNAGRLPQH